MRMLPHRRRVLWKLSRAGQLVLCEVTPHPFGMELRYLVNGKTIVSRVFEDKDVLEAAAASWCEGLMHRGWHTADEPAREPVPVAS
jgi:hypothetical protein